MKFIKALTVTLTLSIATTGCSLMAPKYEPSIDNVQSLKSNGNKAIKVGSFTTSGQALTTNPISIRNNSMSSPYGNSYAAFIEAAITSELALAQRQSKNADLEITGELLKSDIDASSFSKGTTTIEAKFVVKDKGQVRYDQIKSVQHEFPSHFAGAIAIPNAAQSYGDAVKKLLSLLYKDQAFVDATK